MTRLAKLVLGLLAVAVLCLAAAHAEVSTAATVRKIIVFSDRTPHASCLAIAQGSGGRVVRSLELIHAVVIEMPAGLISVAEARLRRRPEVLRIDDDPRINWLLAPVPAAPATVRRSWDGARPGAAAPALPEFAAPAFRKGQQDEVPPPAGQRVPWGIARVNAAAAWGKTRGEGVKVAVIDTGIELSHPELKPLLAGGWNATDPAKPAEYNDDNGHGTHVSGSIAAVDDGQGVVGVAPRVSLYGVKVLDAGGSGTFSDVIAGMQWAADNGMQVANMSLGASRGNDSLKAAVEALVKAGVTLVAAAGNSGGSVGFPAAYEPAIAVAASDIKDKTAYFSSRGPEVDLIAPGVDVESSYMGGGYDTLSGTSMATPHVAGLAALAIAARGLADPAAVRAALVGAAAPLKDVPPEQQGAGLVDAEALAP